MITFNIHLHGTFPGAAEITKQLTRLETAVSQLTQTDTHMANTIDDLFAAAKKQTDASAAIIAVVTDLRDTIKNKTHLSAADQVTVDAIFKSLEDNAAALIAAANVGTPDETPEDVEIVKEFESLPPEPLVP